MSFPLNDFVQYIPQTILDRGLHCFLDGTVEQISSADSSLLKAKVTGTRVYDVSLRITEGILSTHSCTCPFDGGEWCKHEAAFIFHLQRERLDIKPLTP